MIETSVDASSMAWMKLVVSGTTATQRAPYGFVAESDMGRKSDLRWDFGLRVSAYEMVAKRIADELGGALHAQLGQHAGAMIVDGLDAYPEIGGDRAD